METCTCGARLCVTCHNCHRCTVPLVVWECEKKYTDSYQLWLDREEEVENRDYSPGV